MEKDIIKSRRKSFEKQPTVNLSMVNDAYDESTVMKAKESVTYPELRELMEEVNEKEKQDEEEKKHEEEEDFFL